MNLDVFKHSKETEYLLLSINKNFGALVEQTHRRTQKTLSFRLTQPKENLSFTPPISIKRSWLVGLTSLEQYNSKLNEPEKNTNFELYTGFF